MLLDLTEVQWGSLQRTFEKRTYLNFEVLIVQYSDGRLLNGLDHSIGDHGKKFGNQMPFSFRTSLLDNTECQYLWDLILHIVLETLIRNSYQSFYHSNSQLLVCYSRHGLNNGQFDEPTTLDHLNTNLPFKSPQNDIQILF